MVYTLDIRPKRQITLPKGLLQSLGLEVGDSIEIKVKGKKAQITSKKQIAIDALREIRRLVKESGISEEEMQESAKQIRIKLNEKRAS
jgi:bifunctional DNA-binding transcriptional regulator/antitoxin component of YhaV-PrlF toxin-antitoxin module